MYIKIINKIETLSIRNILINIMKCHHTQA